MLYHSGRLFFVAVYHMGQPLPVNPITWSWNRTCKEIPPVGITQRIGEHGRAVVATAVVVLSGLMWLIPPADVEMENSLHPLNFIP